MTMLGRNTNWDGGQHLPSDILGVAHPSADITGVVDLWVYTMGPHLIADPYHLPDDFIGPALIDSFVDLNCFDAPSLDPVNMAEMCYGAIIDLSDPLEVNYEVESLRRARDDIDRRAWNLVDQLRRSWSADYGHEEGGHVYAFPAGHEEEGHLYVYPAESSQGMEITIDAASAELTHENVMNLLNAIFGEPEPDLSTPGDSDYQLDVCWRCEETTVEPDDEVGLCSVCAEELKDLVDG